MKTVKGSPIFNFYTLLILTINIFFFFKEYDGDNLIKLILVFLVVDIFCYFLAKHAFHYFTYDDKKLIIKNSWNILVNEEIAISDIEDIFLSGSIGGLFIIISFNGKKKSYGTDSLSKNELTEMINEIKDLMRNEIK